ncbi:MAG: UDP-glucose/GDP-mannose dehydrogenase family protein [Spirochaetes bacterium]|nr:UDP-glucose/GDP-mannose dehydrogenase family protein [Spirochaetota bacterium]
MNLIYMGAGFVGACSAAVSADSGHNVLAYDINSDRISKLSSKDPAIINGCLHEEGLAELIIKYSNTLKFSTDHKLLTDSLETCDAVYMCLPTPEKPDGSSDLSAFKKATTDLAILMSKRNNKEQSKHIIIINKSTVPIRTIDLTKKIMKENGAENFGIASNPEFLVEGQAIYDSIHPTRVVIGAESEKDFKIIRKIYQRFYDSPNITYIEMNPYEAAATKLLANSALFAKIAYTYAVAGRACEVFPNMTYENIRKGLATDPRIGKWGLYNSLYAGGSCLIKDAQSLSYQLEKEGVNTDFLHQVLNANDYQLSHFIERAETEAGFSFNNKTIAVLGLSFKQDTNDIRHSGAIGVVKSLLGSNVKEIKAFDPVAMEDFKKLFNTDDNEINSRISYHANPAEALKGTDCLILCTDWPAFRTIGETAMKTTKPPYLIMDGRRMLAHNYDELSESGYTIIAIGSPLIGKNFGEIK